MRFRPLRSASAPRSLSAPVPDRPRDARRRDRVHGRSGDAPRGSVPSPRRCSASCSCASSPRESTRSTPRPARARRVRLDHVLPGGPRLRLQRHRGELPLRVAPLPAGNPVFGMAPPPPGGAVRRVRLVPSLSVARKPASLSHVEAAGVPVAALTAWGLVVETAHAHEGQRILIHAGSGGVGHFAVQFAAYFGAHVTGTASGRNAPGCANSARLSWSITPRPASRTWSPGRCRHRTRRQRATTHTSTARWRCSTRRAVDRGAPGSGRGSRRRRQPRGSGSTGYRVIPDGSALATIARLLDSGAVQVYVDQVFDLDDAAAAHARARAGPHPRQDRAARQRRLTGSPIGDSTRRPSATTSSATASSSSERGSTAASTAARRPAHRRASRARRAQRLVRLEPREQPPAEPEPHRGGEVGGRGHVVPRRRRRIHAARAQPAASAGRHAGRSRPPGASASASASRLRGTSVRRTRRRHGLVPHRAERADAAAGHGVAREVTAAMTVPDSSRPR